MKRLIGMAVLVLLLPIMITCGGGGGDGNSSNASSLPMKGTSGNAVNMNGTWTVCQRDNQALQDLLIQATVNGDAITFNVSFWSAPITTNCQQSNPDATVTIASTATLGAEAPATWTNGQGSTAPPTGVPANANATKETEVYHSATLTLNSQSWVDDFNNRKACGKNTWAKGVPTDVLNCTDIVDSTTPIDYWVVDDSSTPLKLYTQSIGTAAYQVDSINPFLLGGGGAPSVPYSDIDTASGFSTAYLAGKAFYWPKTALNINFIEVRQFTSSTVTWRENLYNTGGTASYTIVNANGINGVIQYNDGVYDLFFNVQSVMNDHIMVCYAYQGIASVKACTIDQAYPWYFDRASAEASFL